MSVFRDASNFIWIKRIFIGLFVYYIYFVLSSLGYAAPRDSMPSSGFSFQVYEDKTISYFDSSLGSSSGSLWALADPCLTFKNVRLTSLESAIDRKRPSAVA